MRQHIIPLSLLLACADGSGGSVTLDTGVGTDTGDVGQPGVDDDNDGWSEEDGDCRDDQPAINPEATDIVGDGVDQNCDGADGFDADGDGHADLASGGDDCDDADPFTFPGAIEIWYDAVDQGCLGDSWTGDYDQDGDGYDAEAVDGDDCLDTSALVRPSAAETNGNGLDDNCNGLTDAMTVTVEWFPVTEPDLIVDCWSEDGWVESEVAFTATVSDVNEAETGFAFLIGIYYTGSTFPQNWGNTGVAGGSTTGTSVWEVGDFVDAALCPFPAATQSYKLVLGSATAVDDVLCYVWGYDPDGMDPDGACVRADPTTW